ncbi:MAG: hypothetical protein FWD31_16045, partial [Planctomycetaceae bacterium]|nr:hypothetical protein [Planctomycetaceae bacterium]
ANGSRALASKCCLAGPPGLPTGIPVRAAKLPATERHRRLTQKIQQRCKHRGMSWTEAGVLAVATYAEYIKRNSHDNPKFHTSS